MSILTAINRRLHGLRDHEHLTVECADLKVWRDEIKRLMLYAPKVLPFPDSLFRARKKQIVEAVHKAGSHGVTSNRLFDIVYGADRDGGPGTGVKILAVHIWAINKRLKPHGVRLRHTQVGRGGTEGVYVMEPL